MVNIVNYSYTDLTPLLDKAKQNSDYLWQQNYNYELNVKRRVLPHEPKERASTVAEGAKRWNLADLRTISKAEKETNRIMAENQKLYQQYREETDKRNAIFFYCISNHITSS